jgi:hypothetical protein
LIFQVANLRANINMEMKVNAILTILDTNTIKFARKYCPLKPEIKFICFFPLPGIIVHPID